MKNKHKEKEDLWIDLKRQGAIEVKKKIESMDA
jgi:hypothetical protein